MSAQAYNVVFNFGNQSYAATIDESSEGAAALKAALPLEVTFEDYGSTERIAYLDNKLQGVNPNTSCTPVKGDLTYYIPWGNLAVFVKSFRHSNSLLYIGHLNDDLLNAIKNSGSTKVTISLAQ